MLTNKKRCRAVLGGLALLCGVATITGCAPSGPKALIKGSRLLQQGKYGPAVTELNLAASLLKTNANAWNYLGIALHQSGQPAEARKAYEAALKLNQDLVITHYNLGCLLLEQNQLDGAKNELTAFTVHDGNSFDGWLKLGVTNLRLRDYVSAERDFAEALRLSSQNAEALNDMGVVMTRRNRTRDAVAYFGAALKHQPDYAPAMLNLAALYRGSVSTRPIALRYYQAYLALRPRQPEWDSVNALAKQLDLEINPAPPPPVQQQPTNPPAAPPSAPTNVIRAPTNPPMRPVAEATNVVKPEPPVVLSRPPPVVPSNPPPRVEQLKPEKPAPPVAPTTEQAVVPPVVEMVKPLPELAPPPESEPKTLTLPDSTSAAAPAAAVMKSNATAPTVIVAERKEPPPAKSFLQRINPLNLFRGGSKPEKKATSLPPIVVVQPIPTETSNTAAVVLPETESNPAPPSVAPIFPRYDYLSPSKPAAGNRAEAEKQFALAYKAQRNYQSAEAESLYKLAVKADPAYFAAQANLGLAAFDAEDLPAALAAYESALAIDPASFVTRYNFALALQKGNYLIDAAQEFERAIASSKSEPQDRLASAHLNVANIYAQEFHQKEAARRHFLKALELDPQNPQATAIRYWLRDNP